MCPSSSGPLRVWPSTSSRVRLLTAPRDPQTRVRKQVKWCCPDCRLAVIRSSTLALAWGCSSWASPLLPCRSSFAARRSICRWAMRARASRRDLRTMRPLLRACRRGLSSSWPTKSSARRRASRSTTRAPVPTRSLYSSGTESATPLSPRIPWPRRWCARTFCTTARAAASLGSYLPSWAPQVLRLGKHLPKCRT